jgi:ankyrin repeat protein
MYLIETKGCNVNLQNQYGIIPLYLALLYFRPQGVGRIAALTYLLAQKNIDFNVKDRTGSTLLHYSCFNVNKLPLDVFKYLIETKGCDVNAKGQDKLTPLHNALRCFKSSHNGDTTVLTYLLNQNSFNPNINGQLNGDLLHHACQNISTLPLSVFKFLIETKGVDVNVQNVCGDTPLHYALRDFKLVNNDSNIPALTYLLRQNDVNANTKGQYTRTLLHSACININKLPIDIFKYLIETLGGDMRLQDKFGDTPSHLALRCFNLDHGGDITLLTHLISQNNFNLHSRGQYGHVLLHLTCMADLSGPNETEMDSDEDYDLDFGKAGAKTDSCLSQIAEMIAERYIQQIFGETTP